MKRPRVAGLVARGRRAAGKAGIGDETGPGGKPAMASAVSSGATTREPGDAEPSTAASTTAVAAPAEAAPKPVSRRGREDRGEPNGEPAIDSGDGAPESPTSMTSSALLAAEPPADGAAPARVAPVPPPAGWATTAAEQIVFRWDLDKTYLRTEFESLRKMVRIPFESAGDKVHLPGVRELIRSLRRSAVRREVRPYVFFLSASPPQIGGAIREKLTLDGIEYDGITFKDQLRNLVRGKWRSLREQVGYKLGELLRSRLEGPSAAVEVLFGDDWESDPLIYSLYADIVAGRVATPLLTETLAHLGVERSATLRIVDASSALAERPVDVVLRIYINLERRTPPGRFQPYGRRLVPTFNYFQTAASLFEIGLLDGPSLVEIAAALVTESGHDPDRLRNSVDDLVRRGHLRATTRTRVLDHLYRAHLVRPAPDEQVLRARLEVWMERWRRRWSSHDARATTTLDYVALVRGTEAAASGGPAPETGADSPERPA